MTLKVRNVGFKAVSRSSLLQLPPQHQALLTVVDLWEEPSKGTLRLRATPGVLQFILPIERELLVTNKHRATSSLLQLTPKR